MRTVIYARFSSTLQNSRSIEDQIAICRERCTREGWQIVEIFNDYAISGAAGIDEQSRPGMNAMLARVEAGGIDIVLAEGTDRIARHQGDAFAIRERIMTAGARLFTLADGEVSDITATFRGLMDAQFRKDLGAKVKRGQRGTLKQGRSPAGIAFGYRKVLRFDEKGEAVLGLRDIDPDTAPIVQRIFTQYASGMSPRAIADQLNGDRITGPSGGIWRASTINGDRARKNGMLQNQIYIGRLVFNRTRKISDPRTRKALIRPNPENEWLIEEAPSLRIIDDILWQKVQEIRNRGEGKRPHMLRRPKHMLSGLVRCGVCDGSWTIRGPERWACATHREGGPNACTNNRIIKTEIMEARVIEGLQNHMLDPVYVEAYLREYHLQHERRSREIARESDRLRRRHREATAKFDRLVDAVANGANEFAEIREVLARAREERDALAEEIAGIEQLPVIALHPTILANYRAEVGDLLAALKGNPAARLEAIPRLRSLVAAVVISPAPAAKGVTIEVQGRLAQMLALATGQPISDRPSVVKVERAKGISRYHTLTRARV